MITVGGGEGWGRGSIGDGGIQLPSADWRRGNEQIV